MFYKHKKLPNEISNAGLSYLCDDIQDIIMDYTAQLLSHDFLLKYINYMRNNTTLIINDFSNIFAESFTCYNPDQLGGYTCNIKIREHMSIFFSNKVLSSTFIYYYFPLISIKLLCELYPLNTLNDHCLHAYKKIILKFSKYKLPEYGSIYNSNNIGSLIPIEHKSLYEIPMLNLTDINIIDDDNDFLTTPCDYINHDKFILNDFTFLVLKIINYKSNINTDFLNIICKLFINKFDFRQINLIFRQNNFRNLNFEIIYNIVKIKYIFLTEMHKNDVFYHQLTYFIISICQIIRHREQINTKFLISICKKIINFYTPQQLYSIFFKHNLNYLNWELIKIILPKLNFNDKCKLI